MQRKGPPTREEIEAISEKYGMGVALTADENNRFLDYFQQRRNAWDIGTFLSVAYPNCEWSIQPQTRMDRMADDGSGQSANDLDLLVWDEDNPLPKPTKAEIDKMRPFVQDILDQQAYLTLRAKAYPPESELVKALWEYVVEGDDELMNALQARRIAVKIGTLFMYPVFVSVMTQGSSAIRSSISISPSLIDSSVFLFSPYLARISTRSSFMTA